MKVYTEIVECKTCPNRCPMKNWYKDGWDDKYYDRYLCTEGKDVREIKLHDSLDAPDWCPLPDWDENADKKKSNI